MASERIASERAIKEISQVIINHLNNVGGVRKDDLFISELRQLLEDENLHHWHLRFLSEISSTPLYYPFDSDFNSFWYLDKKTIPLISRFLSHLEKSVSNKKEDLVVNNKFDVYFVKAAKLHDLADFVGLNYLSISKKFSVNAFGDWGLRYWEEINPKTIREKSYLVLKKQNQPMHFREISDTINKANLGGRKAHPQTVHNELIKDPRFILVGRGTYGLGEHGYMPGTAREVISRILKQKGPMTLSQIIGAVGKQRLLKQNTIVINLHDKKYFKKLADGKYSVK